MRPHLLIPAEALCLFPHLWERATMPASQLFQHGHAVVVGVGGDLPMSAQDAIALGGLLKDTSRCGYPTAHVEQLDGVQATRTKILTALDNLASRCKDDPEAIALVYYSGHGQLRRGDGTYFLVPHGFDWARFSDTAITGAEFSKKIQAIGSKGLLVLLDCCHAGAFGAQAIQKGEDEIRQSPMPPDLVSLPRLNGRAVVASSQANELSLALRGQPHSIFTAALLEGLAGYGARQRDGVAYFIDVLGWIGHQVPQRTRGQQHPILDFAQVPINFPLALYAGGDVAPKQLPGGEPVPAPQEIPPPAAVAPVELPHSVRLIDALCELTSGEFETIITGLDLKRADIGGLDQRSQANSVYRLAKRDRSGKKLQLLCRLVQLFGPIADR
jgi:hypothetical protein